MPIFTQRTHPQSAQALTHASTHVRACIDKAAFAKGNFREIELLYEGIHEVLKSIEPNKHPIRHNLLTFQQLCLYFR